MHGGSLKRFSPKNDRGTQYGGALWTPVASGVGKTVKRALKRKVHGVADKTIDKAAGVLAKRAK